MFAAVLMNWRAVSLEIDRRTELAGRWLRLIFLSAAT
jgi:hypothetical protein